MINSKWDSVNCYYVNTIERGGYSYAWLSDGIPTKIPADVDKAFKELGVYE